MDCSKTGRTNDSSSLMRVPRASNARLPRRFRATVMARTPTAAMATTRPHTTIMALCTDHRLFPLSRASSAAAVAVAALLAARPPPQGRHQRPRVVGQIVLLCTANAVVKGGLARLAAPLEPARLPTITTPSACRWNSGRKCNMAYHSDVYNE
jgi:hypothetical protein